jgi:hypothetical protein
MIGVRVTVSAPPLIGPMPLTAAKVLFCDMLLDHVAIHPADLTEP